MKLLKLEIKINGEITRSVKFNDGLNIVTNTFGVGRSGNSVGKSTLSRVIDFLFIGSIDSIYIDEEFKKPNHDIEQLFHDNNVTAQLFFLGTDKKNHSLKRNLSIKEKDDIFWVDDIKIEDPKQYEELIQKHCFGINTRRPSVRSIAVKFIRNDSHKMLNTIKFLGPWAGKKDYSELFLYLFGFNNGKLLTDKRDAANLIRIRKRNSASINYLVKDQKPKNQIEKYIKEADKLEADLLKFDFAPKYENPLKLLSDLQEKENKFVAALLSIERKLSNIKDTVSILTKKDDIYLENEVKAIYEYAGVSIENSLRELKEVFSFHNHLVTMKKQFLSIDTPELEESKKNYETELKFIKNKKLEILESMKSKESINNVTLKIKALSDAKLHIGEAKGILDQQNKAKEDLKESQEKLSEILELIKNENQEVYKFETSLNKKLKFLTKKIHDDEYEFHLNYDDESGDCNAEVVNSVTNPEGGKKKAEVIAFDMSYIHSVNKNNINRPTFVFHDSIEDIDTNQIKLIFDEAKKIPGQQIISILSDKIGEENYNKYKPNIILFLDENNKFFNV